MNDQHITAIATIVQDFLLLASALLIAWYLSETRKMRKAAEAQVEAAFRPSVIVWHVGSLESSPTLENIGNGPAMEVSWALSDSDFSGNVAFLHKAYFLLTHYSLRIPQRPWYVKHVKQLCLALGWTLNSKKN